jgi:predicted dienelactone hydrolase
MLFKMIKKIITCITIAVLSIIVLVIAIVGYLVTTHNQPLNLPTPTGANIVGRSEYDWIDESRIDPLSYRSNEKRELLVWVWYPAGASQQNATAPYLPPDWVKARDKDQGVGKYIESNYSSILTHSFVNVPLAESAGAYPLIIMQPGMGPVPTDYTVFAENLASHGYIVFGINQTYTSNVIVFPDGRIDLRSAKGTIPDNADAATADKDANAIGKVWADDAIFVTDKIQSMNADPSSFFYHELDLARIGYFGHSFGGATAIRVCELDQRCKAEADLDGTLFSYETNETIQHPVMFMAEDTCGASCDTMRQMYSGANSQAYYLSIKGSKHFNFSDLPLRLSPLARILFNRLGFIGSIQPARAVEISNAYLVAFFDQYLKGINSDLLQSESSPYPEVKFQKR